jgi:murein DD-endopeptidase MepM/ murein hydrolase activator NlpD
MVRTLLITLAVALPLAAAAPARASVALEPGELPPVPPTEVFPVLGKVHYGGFANRFGGGRGHQGHDVFARCGTPLVAADAGRVIEADYHGAAGNFVIVRTDAGRSHVYMHLHAPARVKAGELVGAGETLGSVGQSGNAWDCHLHFEIWTAPGWYRGGHPIDPLPFLRALP